MKISRVDIYDLSFEEAPNWHPVLIRLVTDEGLTGLGEVGLAYGTGHSAAVGMVRNLVEGFSIGADPFQSEKLWDEMFRQTSGDRVAAQSSTVV